NGARWHTITTLDPLHIRPGDGAANVRPLLDALGQAYHREERIDFHQAFAHAPDDRFPKASLCDPRCALPQHMDHRGQIHAPRDVSGGTDGDELAAVFDVDSCFLQLAVCVL